MLGWPIGDHCAHVFSDLGFDQETWTSEHRFLVNETDSWIEVPKGLIHPLKLRELIRAAGIDEQQFLGLYSLRLRQLGLCTEAAATEQLFETLPLD